MNQELQKGDVIKWQWIENGVAVAGGTGLVLPDGRIFQRTPYDIRVQSLAEIGPHRFQKLGNIFKDETIKNAYAQP